MGYQTVHYYKYGNTNNCIEAYQYVPDGDALRSQITNLYKTYFGRYGEPGGVEGYVAGAPSNWGGAGLLADFLKNAEASGEGPTIAENGKHTGLSTGGCPVKGCTDPQANNYNSSADTDDGSCTYSPPTVSLSVSPSSMILGNTVTLTYSSSGVGLSSATLTNISNPGFSGTKSNIPTSTTTYTYRVCGTGGCTSVNRTVTVYIPPVITLSLNKSSIVAGQTVRLSWDTSGDGDTIYWTKGDVTNGNLTSFEDLTPGDTTEYCAYVTGLGGTSPTSCATITVYQIPVIEKFDVPSELLYGQQGKIEYEVKYANNSVSLQTIYNYKDTTVDKGSASYTASGSAELNGSNTTITNIIDTEIEYDNFGPRSITYILTISGSGGQVTKSRKVDIIIDETPDNLNVEETPDRIKDEDPVYTQNIIPEEVITSDLYYIDGIDIPIEIKSDFPIQVDVNQSGNWKNIREL